VEVSIKVNRQGQVIDVSSSSDIQMLRESALAAAKKATFSAEKLGNRGTTGIITYTFNP
jgi:TonB family protein